jgi:hypothetical protein
VSAAKQRWMWRHVPQPAAMASRAPASCHGVSIIIIARSTSIDAHSSSGSGSAATLAAAQGAALGRCRASDPHARPACRRRLTQLAVAAAGAGVWHAGVATARSHATCMLIRCVSLLHFPLSYTLKMWPHKFKAVYTVRCGTCMCTRLCPVKGAPQSPGRATAQGGVLQLRAPSQPVPRIPCLWCRGSGYARGF